MEKSTVPGRAAHAALWYIGLMMACLWAFLLSYVIHLISFNWRRVPWLDDKQKDEHCIDNTEDKWVSFDDTKGYKELTRFGIALTCCKGVVCFTSYVAGMMIPIIMMMPIINLHALFTVRANKLQNQTLQEGIQADEEWFSMWTFLISNCCNFVLSLYLSAILLLHCLQFPHQSPPFLSTIYVPFTLR